MFHLYNTSTDNSFLNGAISCELLISTTCPSVVHLCFARRVVFMVLKQSLFTCASVIELVRRPLTNASKPNLGLIKCRLILGGPFSEKTKKIVCLISH